MIDTRRVICIALLCYCAGLFTLALYPTNDIHPAEWLCVIGACVAAIGLVARMSDSLHVPGERYAYLVVGFVGWTTLLLFLLDVEPGAASTPQQVMIVLLLMSGVIGGYGAYLVQGDDSHVHT